MTSAESLFEDILKSLKKTKVHLNFIVGQSYDGVSHMRGRHSGLRTRMLEYAKNAQYVWCHAHRLNLVTESMLGCRKVIGLIQEMYNCFNSQSQKSKSTFFYIAILTIGPGPLYTVGNL